MEPVIRKIEFQAYDYKAKEILETTIDDCLSLMGHRSHFPAIFYIVDELATNADNANHKRTHFIKESLDINLTKDYLEGIKTFKKNLFNANDNYVETSIKNNYYIDIELDFDRGRFIISITNNNKILPIEVSKINNLINISKSFNSVEEVLKTNMSSSDGGGLGIILTMLTLKKLGFSENSFRIDCIDGSTTAKIEIDFTKSDVGKMEQISKDALDEISEIPQFPEHILEIMRIFDNPQNNFNMVSDVLKKDPSLIADLIKTANSTMFILPKKVDSIDEAVRLLGITTIKNLIMTYATNKIFMNRYNLNLINDMMKHSSEVAYYCYEIARFLRLKEIMETLIYPECFMILGK
ncbi:MAG TPA: HDOD domain-containing protein [Spirochaetota bacterium]|nr:HDOD domain-containing protein [Spirochaetota bacterium]